MSRAPRFPLSRSNPRAEPDARGYDPRYAPQPDPRHDSQAPQYPQQSYRPQPPYPQPYAPPEPRSAPSDPLSELARLIGETKPFDEPPRQAARGGGWPGQPQPPGYSAGLPPLMPEYRNDPPPPMPDPRYAPPAPPRYGQQYTDHRQDHYDPPEYGHQPQGPYYGDDGRLMPQDPYEAGHYDYGEPRRRRSGGVVMAGAVAGLVLLGLGGAYAYRTMLGGGVSGPPPLIKADTAPSKIVPAQSGENPSGKQIYDRVGSSAAQDEKIVSREEQPVDIRTAARPAFPSAGTLAPPSSNALMAPAGTVTNNPIGSQNAPRPVKTVPIRPDSQGNASQPPQRAATVQPHSTPAPSSRAAPAAAANAPLSLTPGSSSATARTHVSNAAEASAASTAAPAGIGYMVQVSAQKTQAEATSAFKSAQAKMPNLLGSYQVVLRKKESRPQGTMYGAQVGPFETKADADGLCAQIKSAGGNCFVEKN